MGGLGRLSIRQPYSTAEPDLKTTFREAIPAKKELLTRVKAMAEKEIGTYTVANTIGGMRYFMPCACPFAPI